VPSTGGDAPSDPASGPAADLLVDRATAPETDASTGRSRVRYLELDWRTLLVILVVFSAFLLVFRTFQELPASFTALVVAGFLSLALNPLVSWVEERLSLGRGVAVAVVLVVLAVVMVSGLLLLGRKTVEQAGQIQSQLPSVLKQMTELPVVGKTLADNDIPNKAQQWLADLPTRMGSDQNDLSQFVATVTQGLGYVLLTTALIVMLLLDGPLLARRTRQLIPSENQARANRLGEIVYNVIARYFAGSLLLGFLTGMWVLITGLILNVPLTPVLAVWAGLTALLPQIGGALGAAFVVAVALTGPHGVITALIMGLLFFAYMTFSNNVLLPVVVGRAINVSPPTTMLAAIGGFAVAGIVGALFAMPVVGAAKAIALEVRPPVIDEPPPEEPPKPKRRLGLVAAVRQRRHPGTEESSDHG
jgi:predicted PurR-regulated permease PerM